MIKIGDKTPDFTLTNQDNNPVRLSGLSGKWVVVYFYPKDDTPGCTVEACHFRDTMNIFKENNVSVLGISKDSVKSHKKFHDKYHLNFDILSDPTTEVIQDFGAWQEKSIYGRKFMGIQRMTYIISPKGKITAIFPKVTPKGHEQDVLSYIGQQS